jgi:hypothetical protein
MHYEIEVAQRLVRWTHTGEEPPGMWTRTLDQILADPAFSSGFNFVEDLRADPTPPTTMDVHQGAAFIAAHRHRLGPCHWAVVVPAGSPLFFGMIRMANLLLETSPILLRPFTDLDEALNWLGASGPADA